MKTKSLFLSLVFVFFSSILQSSEKIKVLIVDGYSNHDWRYTTQVIYTLLEESGFCKIDISTAPTKQSSDFESWNPDFSNYDVVVQNTNNYGSDNNWPVHVQKKFEKYMKSGGGMYVFHSANNSFSEWEEYNKMIGLGWRKPHQGAAIEIVDDKAVLIPVGKGEETSHGSRLDLVLNQLNAHPINSGFPKKWKTTDIELYTYARGAAENMTILSYAYDEKTKKNWPIDWVVNYGSGRIYNATFGHIWHELRLPPNIQCVGFQTTFLRAIQWLAGKEISVKIPGNFPGKDKISLRPFDLSFSPESGWISLFNGVDLEGWSVQAHQQDLEKNFWQVKNEVIECNSIGNSPKDYVWLVTNKEFDDFVLNLKFQVFQSSKGNSGVQIRSRYDKSETARRGGWLDGPQVDIHPPLAMRCGLIYDETDGENRWIYPSKPDHKIGEEDFPEAALKTELKYADNNENEWNTMEIVAEGMHIKTFVNGKRVSDYDATGHLDDLLHQQKGVGQKGHIALQLHSSHELHIRFKDIYIKPIQADRY